MYEELIHKMCEKYSIEYETNKFTLIISEFDISLDEL